MHRVKSERRRALPRYELPEESTGIYATLVHGPRILLMCDRLHREGGALRLGNSIPGSTAKGMRTHQSIENTPNEPNSREDIPAPLTRKRAERTQSPGRSVPPFTRNCATNPISHGQSYTRHPESRTNPTSVDSHTPDIRNRRERTQLPVDSHTHHSRNGERTQMPERQGAPKYGRTNPDAKMAAFQHLDVERVDCEQ